MGRLIVDARACLNSRLHNCGRRSGQLQFVRATETFKSSHRPDGKTADALASTLALHNWECFGQLQYVRAAETFKSSHCPDGKNADALADALDSRLHNCE